MVRLSHYTISQVYAGLLNPASSHAGVSPKGDLYRVPRLLPLRDPQPQLTEAARLLDLSEHRLGQLLS